MITGWYEIEGAWYFFANNGEYVVGIVRAPYNGDTKYPYYEADLKFGGETFMDATESWFYFDENGKFLANFTGMVGNRYFVNGCAYWHVGMVKIEGKYYYFGGDKVNGGNILATDHVYATRDFNSKLTMNGTYYMIDVNGNVIVDNGIVEMNGGYYYFVDGKLAKAAGVVKMSDENGTYYIYVKSNGQLATGIYWPTKLNDELERGCYDWGNDGKMYTFEMPAEKEIREDAEGNLFYYENGIRKPGAGVVKMTDAEGKTFYIYVMSNGQLATGKYWPTNRNDLLERGCYNWGEDGKYYPSSEHEIRVVDGKLYYFYKGRITGAGLIELDGEIYYVRTSTGEVVTGKYAITQTNGMDGFETGDVLKFGKDGKLIRE